MGSKQADLHVEAKITIDASDWGEAIQVSGAAFEYGPDPPSRYGEPSAPKDSPINEMNPITWPMIVAESDEFVAVERTTVIDRQTTAEREFAEVDVEVKVTDGRLTIDIGSGLEKSNTCLNWLQIWLVKR